MNEYEEKMLEQIAEAKTLLETKKSTETMKTDSEDLQVPSTSEQTSESNTDSVLEEAIKQGYNPHYEGLDKKTPEQFIRDGSFFKKIEAQKKDIQELKKLFQESETRSLRIEQETREKVLRQLQEQKEQA